MFVAQWLRRVLLLAMLFGTASVEAGSSSGRDLLQRLNNALAEAAETTARSVVVVSVVRNQPPPNADADRPAYQNLPPGARQEFDNYFKEIPLDRRSGQGSGIILRKNGFVLTNRHVVEDTETIEVKLRDGRTFPAKIQGADPLSDLAVIKIEATDLLAAKFGDSDKIRVGEMVIAVGAPYSLDYSTTFGHVSAKGRSNILPGYLSAMMDQDFIQTDALINPGNSGGPLANIDGEVVGINTLIQGMHTGIGFAVPSNAARAISDQLIATGKYPRAWLGLELRELKPGEKLAEVCGNLTNGVVISKVLPEGPAAESEIKELDVVQAVNGIPVKTTTEVRRFVRSARIGQTITFAVAREKAKLTVRVRTGEYQNGQ